MRQKLGQAARIDAASASTMDHLYQYAALDESWLIAMNLVIGPRGVDVIHVTAVRRGKTPFPYLGRTLKGYAVGEDVDRLHALYGAPTEIFTMAPGGPSWFWYRSAGLIISPPIEGEASHEAAQFTVVPPNITAGEARHLLFR